jgi:hypothetical protein
VEGMKDYSIGAKALLEAVETKEGGRGRRGSEEEEKGELQVVGVVVVDGTAVGIGAAKEIGEEGAHGVAMVMEEGGDSAPQAEDGRDKRREARVDGEEEEEDHGVEDQASVEAWEEEKW